MRQLAWFIVYVVAVGALFYLTITVLEQYGTQ